MDVAVIRSDAVLTPTKSSKLNTPRFPLQNAKKRKRDEEPTPKEAVGAFEAAVRVTPLDLGTHH